MKIVMVANGMGIGGAETHIVALITALKAKGHTIVLAAPRGVYMSFISKMGVKVRTIPAFDGSVLSFFAQWKALRKICKAQRPQLLHAHARPSALAAFLVSRELSLPLVTTAHLPFKSRKGSRFLTRWGDGVLAVSKDIKEHLLTYYKVPSIHIQETVNGIDTDLFCAKERDDKKRRVVHISRLDDDRAQTARLLIDIAPRLAKEDLCDELLIVGDGNCGASLRHRAEAVNRKIGYAFVLMIGASDNVSRYLFERPLFVGVSRAALEAMASECTVILSGNEGYGGFVVRDKLPFYAKENFCCRGCCQATSGRLIDDIRLAFSLSNEERMALGRDMRQYVFDNFTPKRMAEDAEVVYFRVVRAKRTPAIILCGYHGYGNTGDELSLTPLIEKCRQKSERLLLLSRHPRKSRSQYGINTLYRYRLLSLLFLMKKGDWFLFVGGNLFQNQTGMRSLLYYFVLAEMAKIRGCHIGFLRGGIGELHGSIAKRMTRRVLKESSFIGLRCEEDLRLASMLMPSLQKNYLCDASLLSAKTEPFIEKRKKIPYITVALRPERENVSSCEIKKTADAIGKFCEKRGCRAVLLPFHISNDRAYLSAIAKELPSCVMIECTDGPRLREILRGGICTITSRLHAGYLSLLEKTPCIFIRYDKKTEGHVRMIKKAAKRIGVDSPIQGPYAKIADIFSLKELPFLTNGDYERLLGALGAK